MNSIVIDFTQYFQQQTVEETIEVLDDILTILVVQAEENGMQDNFSHQYLTIKNLRNLFIQYSKEDAFSQKLSQNPI